MGWLLRLRFLQGKQVVQAAFCFSDDLKSTAVNPSCFSNRQNRKIHCNLLPPPWGRAGERASPEWRQSFLNTLSAPIQALRLVALSLTLSRGREDGRLLGLRVLQGNRLCRLFFTFQTTFINAQFRQPAP